MNKMHQDGHALLKLSRLTDGATPKGRPSGKNEQSKPAPPKSIQRQDTDYDVKPEIPAPNPVPGKSKPEKARQQTQAPQPDDGIAVRETQMGESEDSDNRDAETTQSRMLRSICI